MKKNTQDGIYDFHLIYFFPTYSQARFAREAALGVSIIL